MRLRPWHLSLLLVALILGCSDAAGETLLITRGGTYTGGEYESIAVNTAEPVVIENLSVRARGHLITSHYKHANLTIRNVRGYAVNPNAAGKCAGRFANLEGFNHVVTEDCLMEGTSGVYL